MTTTTANDLFGNYLVHYEVADEDDEDSPLVWAVYDGDMDCVDAFDTREEAIDEAERLDRQEAIEQAREAIQEAIDEADGSDDHDTLDRLTQALAILRPTE